MRRRDSPHTPGAGSALAFLPAFTRHALAEAATLDELTITSVEILEISGTHELVPGLNRQYQVQPPHLYEERRPKPFKVQGRRAAVIQADPEWCGGVSETVKIAKLCAVHGVKLLPHCHNVHAALHIVASQSPAVYPFGEYLINHVTEKLHFMKDPLITTNGLVTLPEKPGFGIELDSAKVEKQEVLTSL